MSAYNARDFFAVNKKNICLRAQDPALKLSQSFKNRNQMAPRDRVPRTRIYYVYNSLKYD